MEAAPTPKVILLVLRMFTYVSVFSVHQMMGKAGLGGLGSVGEVPGKGEAVGSSGSVGDGSDVKGSVVEPVVGKVGSNSEEEEVSWRG